MSTVKAAFHPAMLRRLEITYRCDLTRVDGAVIPLGILADLSVDDIYGLGLVARKSLSPSEEEMIGSLVRADFAAPFAYLHSIFEEVFKAENAPEVFAGLVDQHTHSLRFNPLEPMSISLPRPLVTASIDTRGLWVKDELASHGNTAYWHLFPEHVPEVVEKKAEEGARELKAAA
jgi:hypothetical protein